MMPNEHRAFKLGLSAVMLWSTVATAFSISLRYLTPLQLVALASAVSWCFLSLRLLQPARWQALRATAMRDRLFGLAMGWLNPALYYLVLFAAYDRLPAQEAMAINYSWGITLALIAAPLLGQKLSLYSLLTSGISYFGIVVIATRGEPEALNFAQPEGVALALLSTLIWSLYWVINARKEIDPEVQLFLNFTGALPLLSALVWYQGAAAPVSWQGWAGGVYVGLFEMGFAFVLWMGAMQATRSTIRISSLIFLSPPVSLLFIWLIAGEALRPYTLVGLLLILLGLWLQRRADI
ncbi:MAG: EamA family transporter [Halieaceae bacterium]|jgi:drug/metabolite transporter (DMT)-like permease|nr:EamA family transporter [Halieaceae bacterium]|tara:strand:- start:4550 stop:5431 length:882 start_codon:yes stop_codon:yes gene_type:complete